MLKKYIAELSMAVLLLISFFFLSREAAQVSGKMASGQEQKPVIAIDPGHGGDDPGMIGVGGLEEKGINLEVSQRLKSALEQKGFAVVMTRDEDQGLYDASAQNKKAQDMQRRISLLDEAQPVLTVSIHQNSYQDSGVRGPQVFYYKDSLEGERLAKVLQDSLNTGLEIERPREAKGNTSYYLLKRSTGTLVIVECGFLTNPDEAALLQTEAYQSKVAEAIAQGICQYQKEQG